MTFDPTKLAQNQKSLIMWVMNCAESAEFPVALASYPGPLYDSCSLVETTCEPLKAKTNLKVKIKKFIF